jgi:hypothetical protein
LLCNSSVEYAISRVQANQEGLKLNNSLQILFYADDVYILRGSVYTTQKNRESLVVASKETGLEVNADKTKYMVMFREWNAGRNHNIKMDYSTPIRLEDLKYF